MLFQLTKMALIHGKDWTTKELLQIFKHAKIYVNKEMDAQLSNSMTKMNAPLVSAHHGKELILVPQMLGAI